MSIGMRDEEECKDCSKPGAGSSTPVAEGADSKDEEKKAAQRQAEYEIAKNFCDNMGPEDKHSSDTDSKCSYLSRAIDHAEKCVDLYEEWDEKWLPGRHADKIFSWQNRIDNLKREHRLWCTEWKIP